MEQMVNSGSAKNPGKMHFSSLQAMLQDAFAEQNWFSINMEKKAVAETSKEKKQKYTKAFFAALGGEMAIKKFASRLGVKIE